MSFCMKLREILKQGLLFLIRSWLVIDLKDLRLEQKYKDSRIVVLPALLAPVNIVMGVLKFILASDTDLKS